MTQNTPIYGLPYPEFTDAPDGPTQIAALATAVETVIARTDKKPTNIIFTASGSLLASQVVGAKSLRIRGVNGGAGSGGAALTGAGASSGGGSGGGGAYAEIILNPATLTFPLQVTVGGGGAGGAATPANGVKGGQSIVKDNNGAGATLWTPGVQGGQQAGQAGAAGSAVAVVSVGGFDSTVTGTVADFVVLGTGGLNAFRIVAGQVVGVPGGASVLGGGAAPNSNPTGQGVPGLLYGGGAASVHNGPSQAAGLAGVAGAAGIVIVEAIY